QTTELMPSCFVDVKRSYTKIISGLPSPLTLGIPKEWFKHQKFNTTDKHICFNHCLLEASSTIPVSLYSSIFDKFKKFCIENSEKEDNQFIYNICHTMVKYYDKEEKCQDKANKMLKKYLSYLVELLMIKHKDSDSNLKDARTDDTVFFSKHCVANLKYKSNDYCSNISPYLENCNYYLVLYNKQANSSSNISSSYITNFPCFLVTIVGIVILA
ncbi:14228_t:CDS:1, partial [Dentiscutata heterogama]